MNEDFHLSSTSEYNSADEEGDAQSGQLQSDLNLIGASLGITLDGQPARASDDVFGDFLHNVNQGNAPPLPK